MTDFTIDDEQGGVTSISTFPVDPARQRELAELLTSAAEELLRHEPGFIACGILSGVDGTQVVNYARWESEEAMRTMIAKPEIRERMAAAWALSKPDPRRFTVESVHVP
ncbi:putative quinol monooxygenase [Umezawaea sp. NPDC059074]|uniref:putative quinol monooxygenase n=1 Tax=Umezawaea sp. NPDC059074 TaxID=3346716 RepID=UPI0036BBCCFF